MPSRMRLTPSEEAALRARRRAVARDHRSDTEALLDAADAAEHLLASGRLSGRAEGAVRACAVAAREHARERASLDVLPQTSADWLDGPSRAAALELCVRAGVVDVRLVG